MAPDSDYLSPYDYESISWVVVWWPLCFDGLFACVWQLVTNLYCMVSAPSM